MTDLIDGVPYFGHDGGVWGVNAVFRMTPDNDVVVALSNVSPGAGQRAAMRAADRGEGERFDSADALFEHLGI